MSRLSWSFALLMVSFLAVEPVWPVQEDEETLQHELLFVQRGDLPIVLTAPHAGPPSGRIPGVPERVYNGRSGFNTKWDTNTDRLTREVAAQLESRLGKKPYVVMALFNRAYADANRPLDEAVESPLAEPYYTAYHRAIGHFVAEVNERWKHGIHLDLHGQSTDPQVIHWGTRDGKTESNLRKRRGTCALDGSRSIRGVLHSRGYDVFPARGKRENRKFNGGYTVDTYGSNRKNGIDAIQIEIGYYYRSSKERLGQLAVKLAQAIEIFYEEYYSQ